ncbi:hypothetical protein [Natronococcus sp. A-GB7]|uniref:hypothetical protein n=1 Tax=Natronococcus sp. A-GB7 TaxID=3037649 RepID=UPI00241ED34A|nr:hypothetical protein [Natronococcus sp. A-GB7]MDG5820374.1 hypothetical protein [Natronococcus sp. A-GB7]
MSNEIDIPDFSKLDRRKALETLATAGTGAILIPGIASADPEQGKTNSRNNKNKGIEEKLSEEYLAELDDSDIGVVKNLATDDIEFATTTDTQSSEYDIQPTTQREIELLPENDYLYLSLALADGPSSVELRFANSVLIEGNLPNGSFSKRRMCGDVGFAHGCMEMTYWDEPTNDFYYEIDVDYWSGSWNNIHISNVVDLDDPDP